MVLILRIVYNEGFSINPEKTRVARSNARQEVTGIVVNSHMQISKEKRKQIRQQIYYIRKYGLESHLERIEENRANYLNHLLGQINFALFVNPKDEEMKEYFGPEGMKMVWISGAIFELTCAITCSNSKSVVVRIPLKIKLILFFLQKSIVRPL